MFNGDASLLIELLTRVIVGLGEVSEILLRDLPSGLLLLWLGMFLAARS